MQIERNKYDKLFKLLLIGDSGVGKTAILMRFADDAFTSSFISTIGIDFKIRTIELEGLRIKLQIWDTAGQERFKTITTAYYRGAQGIFLVYDVSNRKSFDNVQTWIKQIETHNNIARVILIANKQDIADDIKVISSGEGKQLADKYKIKFIETSAKSDFNVEYMFSELARDIKHQQEPDAIKEVTKYPNDIIALSSLQSFPFVSKRKRSLCTIL